MKKLILFLTIGFMITLGSCNQKQETKTKEAAVADSANPCPCPCPPDKVKVDPTCKYCVDSDSHNIDFTTVRRMVEDFRVRFTGQIANGGGFYTLSGLPVRDPKLVKPIETLVFFPAVDKKLGKDILFLATEVKICDDAQTNCEQSVETPGPNLICPGNNNFFNALTENDLLNNQAFENYLGNHLTPISAQVLNASYPSGSLNTERANFVKIFSRYYPDPVMAYGKGNTLDDLRDLPNAAGIRYFFGYDAEQETNKIRVIFCAVDAAGAVIVPNGDWDQAFRESSRPRRP